MHEDYGFFSSLFGHEMIPHTLCISAEIFYLWVSKGKFDQNEVCLFVCRLGVESTYEGDLIPGDLTGVERRVFFSSSEAP